MRSPLSRESSQISLDLFERLVNPKLVTGIARKTLDRYVARRRKMQARRRGETVSAETIKKDLRTIRAALTYAHEWGYLPVVPKMPKVDGFESEKRFVLPEHFDAMLSHTGVAEHPANQGYEPGLWWDARLSLLWVAPNRIAAMLLLQWDDLDVEAGTITSQAADNKQKKRHRACVLEVVIEKLQLIRRFDPRIFPWENTRRTLYRQYHRIQQAAGIHLPCDGDHEHAESCHVYGFHDFRRSFATLNGELPVSFQQNQMGHSSYATTLKYVKFAEQQRTYAEQLHLPASMHKQA